MPYSHDVFLSYSHDYPFGEWVTDPFLPLFQGYLTASLGREANIFSDRDIPAGNSWPERLRNALATSRAMVGIWSPNYFISSWCQVECRFMLHRELVCGLRTGGNPNGLIVPVTLHDGDRFPPYAKAIQYADWNKYARVGDGFKKTERYVEFQDRICDWAENVASAIQLAPDWDARWLTDDWLNHAVPDWNSITPAPSSAFAAPTIS
jgi:hypothetical protein